MHGDLYSMPHSKSTLVNYTSILLRGNNLRHLNLTSLFKVFPRVVLLDLRDNNPLLCDDVKRFQPSKLITIISDCTYSMTKIPTNKTTEIPATFSTKPPTHHQNHLTYAFSTRKNQIPYTTNHKQIMKIGVYHRAIPYIYTLVGTLLFIPASVILLRSIIRCWKSRQRPPSVALHLSPLNIEHDEKDYSSDEDVILSRTADMQICSSQIQRFVWFCFVLEYKHNDSFFSIHCVLLK